MWLLIAIAAAAIIGIFLLLTKGDPAGPTAPVTVEVPAVVGQPEEDARTAIEDLDLKFVRHQEPSIDFPKGQVTRTNPEEGTPVEARSEVEVWISTGPDAIEVPGGLKNFTQQQAKDTLAAAGFDVGTIVWLTKNDPEVVQGNVIDTDPVAGTLVSPADPLTVYTSTGLVDLPSLLTMTQQAALDTLAPLRLPSTITEETSDQTPGTVIRQNPPAGLVAQGTSVEIVVAVAPVIVQVAVPDVTGKSYSAAAAALGAANLNAVPIEDIFDPTIPAGKVVKTDPPAGQMVNEGTPVTVYVSKGKDPATP